MQRTGKLKLNKHDVGTQRNHGFAETYLTDIYSGD